MFPATGLSGYGTWMRVGQGWWGGDQAEGVRGGPQFLEAEAHGRVHPGKQRNQEILWQRPRVEQVSDVCIDSKGVGTEHQEARELARESAPGHLDMRWP